ncbi:MAG: hypothetical protein KDC10_02790 [Calditrichaeota bacterium]|nr:hypothetical protein [Candidatus Cloacimonadota bacterium]MCA9786074.1 hypothetical protein [Candidatus Cloacimonadota bacterium]MCB1046104.1 hypothetical protein [Calditrichota bacterium]MCB9473356.1 hypothetical protein [Candidatus Delongbacteria bacterium]
MSSTPERPAVPSSSLGTRMVELCKDKAEFRKALDGLKPMEVLEVQTFFWDFCLRLAEQKGATLPRARITRDMMPTGSYQHSVGCNERMDYCRANICVFTNPNCASTKLRGIIENLRQVIVELLEESPDRPKD